MKTSCPSEEQLQDFFDREDCSVELSAHIHSCSDCQQTLERWENIGTSLRAVSFENPGLFVEQVMKEVERPQGIKALLEFFFGPECLPQGFVLAGALLFFILAPQPAPLEDFDKGFAALEQEVFSFLPEDNS